MFLIWAVREASGMEFRGCGEACYAWSFAPCKEAIDKQKEILGIPDDYLVGIVPASDTGAFEMAMWSMLGARGVDVFAWESFSSGWLSDITKQLKLEGVNEGHGRRFWAAKRRMG